MIFIAVLVLAIATGATVGIVAGAAAAKGLPAAIRAATLMGGAGLGLASLGYVGILAGRRGFFPPEHFVNGVIGNALVVGGMLVGVGLVMGAVAAYALILRRR